jgi:hypothetical protein
MQLPRRFRLINALAARAISHSLVEISAMMAAPNGQNGKGKFVFAITKMSAFIGLFRHFSSTACSTASNAPRGRVGCIVNEQPCDRKGKKFKNHPD